jgi:alkylhydroperoxidase family enzyme
MGEGHLRVATMEDMTDRDVEKITRRYTGLTSSQTVTRLREKYERRREAVKTFTDRLEKSGGFVDEAEVMALRSLGVSDEEINDIVGRYGPMHA